MIANARKADDQLYVCRLRETDNPCRDSVCRRHALAPEVCTTSAYGVSISIALHAYLLPGRSPL